MTTEAIFKEAMSMNTEERVRLARELLDSVISTKEDTSGMELPKGVPILGRGKGKLIKFCDDDEHLNDFAEYMP